MTATLLSTAYLPPVQYISKFVLGHVVIEQHENYVKQSYRNRCSILAANGPLCLSIPIVKDHGQKMPIREVRIDYDLPWQKIHFKSIESAYKNSPFYDYYIDELIPFYEKRFDLLFDYNSQILSALLTAIGIKPNISYSAQFERMPENLYDLRYSLSPKSTKNLTDERFYEVPYYQVFEEKFDFTPNLSVLDLLFNEGPQAKQILESSIKKGG